MGNFRVTSARSLRCKFLQVEVLVSGVSGFLGSRFLIRVR